MTTSITGGEVWRVYCIGYEGRLKLFGEYSTEAEARVIAERLREANERCFVARCPLVGKHGIILAAIDDDEDQP